LGIDVGNLWKSFPTSIASLTAEICNRLGQTRAFSAAQVPLIEAAYIGRRYGEPSETGQSALKRLARLEGLHLDPVYTAKAFAGLLGEVE
jgi:1-aminocyclopropane-1-carboxylate deaminase/D-cysteine desulfhydrase-like pyridoxal-dependent ACC family enzyme